MIIPIGICMGCLTCPASQLPGPLSTPVVDAAATRGVQGSQDGLSSAAWPHLGLHRVGKAEITSAGGSALGTSETRDTCKVVGANITASSREKKKKLKNREYRERKQLLKGRPEWAWSWRGVCEVSFVAVGEMIACI